MIIHVVCFYVFLVFLSLLMKLTVVSRSGKQLSVLDGLNPNSSIDDVRREFYIAKSSFPPCRQRLTFDKTVLSGGKLSDYGMTSDCTITFKDLGPQIQWKTVFLLEYLGPMLVYPIFYFQPTLIYGASSSTMSLAQNLALVFFIAHYMKREFETLFVHRFGNSTMPLRNLFKNSSYYWGNAILCSYFINHPLFVSPPLYVVYIGVVMFLIGELGNFHAHIILRNLRKPGTKERNIPKGGLFSLVSCANYSYEIFGWIGYSVMVSSLAAWIFTAQGALQMYFWALAKHKRYRKEFNGTNGTEVYPKSRKALVPFIV